MKNLATLAAFTLLFVSISGNVSAKEKKLSKKAIRLVNCMEKVLKKSESTLKGAESVCTEALR
jgi:hypothetical protein